MSLHPTAYEIAKASLESCSSAETLRATLSSAKAAGVSWFEFLHARLELQAGLVSTVVKDREHLADASELGSRAAA